MPSSPTPEPTRGAAQTVRVNLAERAYDVALADGALRDLGPRAAQLVPGRRAFLVADAGLPEPFIQSAQDSLRAGGFDVATERINALESNKTIDTASRLLHAIAQTRHERTDPVVALGGGITGDVAGFVGATYRRGVPVIQCPTTLLAMVDASVGGKTGVNLTTRTGLKKNLVGAFWQPTLVLIDVHTLTTLPERHIRSGLAECLKHALIVESTPGADTSDPGAFFRWTNENLIKLRMGNPALFLDLIARNVAIKARVVEADEREDADPKAGGRALLNLGHTYAHAIETIPHLSPDGDSDHAPLMHGEAVAYGLVAAAGAGVALGRLSEDDATAIRIAVERLGLESRLMALPPDDEIIETMSHDKKVAGGRLRLIIPVGLGRAEVVVDPPEEAVRAGLAAIRVRR